MSKIVDVTLSCPSCQTEFDAELFVTLWIEEPRNRQLVFEDRLNVVECSACGIHIPVLMSVMCSNREKNFAVWFEPDPDEQIDRFAQMYEVAMGKGNYLSTAPRISDWEEFKRTIQKFENGELVGKAPTISNVDAALQMAAKADIASGRTAKPGFFGKLFGRKK